MEGQKLKKQALTKNDGKFSNLFWYAVAFSAIFSVWAVMNPTSLTTTLWGLIYKFHDNFNWLVISMPLIICILSFALAFSKYGQIKLGKKDEKPEFSTASWLTMLFTAGLGVGLVNFGVAEPLVHYLSSPLGLPGGFDKVTAAKNAMALTMFNWGIPAWAIYTISGLVIGYFTYHRSAKFLPGTPIEEGFKDKKWGKGLGSLTNILAAGASALTLAASIGLGVFQVKNALKAVFNWELAGVQSSLIILLFIFLSYTIPAISPINKGMKIIGDINIYLVIGVLIFTFVIGPTRFFMGSILTTFGETIKTIVPLGFNVYLFQDRGWFNDWPLTTLVWWVSWTPFLGIFIARISKGRTIKQIVLASIIIPTLFIIIWFSVFGGFGLLNDIAGDGSIAKYIAENPNDVYLSFIMVLQQLPAFNIIGLIFIALVVIFLATTATSAAISLSMMTSNGVENAPPYRTFIWCIIMVTIASANVVTGTLNGVKAVAVFLGVPYMFILFLQIAGMIRQMRKDYKEGAL